MTAHSVASVRSARAIAIMAAAVVLVAACSNAAASPDVGATPVPTATANTMHSPTQAPAATLAASPAASATASPTAQLTTLADAANYEPCPGGTHDGCLNSGTYRLGSDVLATAVTQLVVPGGWFEWDMGPGTEGLLVDRLDAKDGSGWGVLFSSVGLVSRDPCDAKKGTFPAGSTGSADGLVAAMASWPGFDVGKARPVTLGGASGKQVAVTSTKTSAACPDPVLWRTPEGTGFNGYPEVGARPKGYIAQFLLLDVAGKVLAIRTTDFPQQTQTEVDQGVQPDPKRHAADQKTLHGILDSLRLSPGS